MIDFVKKESENAEANIDTQNIFSQVFSKNKIIVIGKDIYASFPRDINAFMIERGNPPEDEAHIILKIACSEMFYTKYSGMVQAQIESPLVSNVPKVSEDEEYEANLDSADDNNLKDIVRSHIRKNERYRLDLLELFEEYEGLSALLIEEIYRRHCEEVKKRNEQNAEAYIRANNIYKEEIKMQAGYQGHADLDSYKSPENYYHMLYSDFIFLFLGIIKNFSRFQIYISFTDYKDHFLIHFWGNDNEYCKLAEKMGTELMLKNYATHFQQAQSRMPKPKSAGILFEEGVNDEKKNELIPKGNDSFELGDLPIPYSKLNFDKPLHLAPYITFTQEKKCKFQRYTKNDNCHECPAQNIEEEDQKDANDKTCGQCSVFRNIDKLRIIYDELDELLKFNYLKSQNILLDIFVIRNFKDYKERLETKAIVFSHWNIFDFEKQLGFVYLIRNYYCETMSYYFLWLISYLRWLLIPSVFGVIIYIVSLIIRKEPPAPQSKGDLFSARDSFQIIFGGLTILWASMFLNQWKQQEEIHNYAWGTENFKHNEPDREDFKPDTNEELMFGKKFPYVSTLKMYSKYFLSYLVLFTMIVITCGLIIGSFWVKAKLGDLKYDPLYISIGVASCNACQIKIMNFIYVFIAEKLNDWENHQKEFQKINSNNIKNVMFDFMNNYFACYYIAFIKRNLDVSWLPVDRRCFGYSSNMPKIESYCVEELEIQLYTTLAIFFAFNALELGLPFAMQVFRFKKYCVAKEINTGKKISPTEIHRNTVEYIQLCDDYNDVSAEYGEMLVLFGFVVLFGVAAPIVPVLAFLLALIEKHVDSFKLNFLVRVSILDGSTGIEMYKYFIHAFIFIGLITNAGITCFTDKDYTHIQQLVNIFIGVLVGYFILTFISKWNILPRCNFLLI